MESDQSRRVFLDKCVKLGGFCSALFIWNKNLLAQDSTKTKNDIIKKGIDLKAFSYCGIKCENECELFKATRENNIELKKQVYEKWKMKENHGIDFDPEKIFCYSCKPGDLPYKFGIKECEIRNCAVKNSMESCVQCKNLVSCDKKFWKRWEGLYKHVVDLQKQYIAQSGSVLVEIGKK